MPMDVSSNSSYYAKFGIEVVGTKSQALCFSDKSIAVANSVEVC